MARRFDAMELVAPMNPDPVPVLGALLAGGESRRMGRPKAETLLGDAPLSTWGARALAAVCDHLVQVGGAPAPGLDWPVIPDRRPGAGPAAAVETALLHAPGAVVVTCPVDTPFVPTSLLSAVRDAVLEGAVACAPRSAGRWHGLCAAYSPALLPRLTGWLDAGRADLQGLLDDVSARPIAGEELERHGDPAEVLMNVNTPEDLAAASARLERN